MRHNTPDTIKRAERFQIILIGRNISWSNRRTDCTFVPDLSGICGKMVKADPRICVRQSGADGRMVCGAPFACLDRGKTGTV